MFFVNSNKERIVFFFKKYRGILVTEDIQDNVLFIQSQLHGVEDQLNSMMFHQRQKNTGREKLFQSDTEKYSKRASAMLKTIKLMRETLRITKNVNNS